MALIASTGKDTGGTSPAIVTTGAKFLAAFVTKYPDGNIPFSDSKGNVWKISPPFITGGPDPFVTYLLWCIQPIVGTGHTFTLTPYIQDAFSVIATDDVITAFDALTNDKQDQFSSVVQPPAITPRFPNSLLLTGFGGDPAAAPTVPLYTIADARGSLPRNSFAYKNSNAGSAPPIWHASSYIQRGASAIFAVFSPPRPATASQYWDRLDPAFQELTNGDARYLGTTGAEKVASAWQLTKAGDWVEFTIPAHISTYDEFVAVDVVSGHYIYAMYSGYCRDDTGAEDHYLGGLAFNAGDLVRFERQADNSFKYYRNGALILAFTTKYANPVRVGFWPSGFLVANDVIAKPRTNIAPVISTATLPSGQLGDPYSQTIASTGGVAPVVYSVSSGALPDDLILNPTTGVLSGTLHSVGTSVFTIRATDYSGFYTEKAFGISVTLSLADFPDPTRTGILWEHFEVLPLDYSKTTVIHTYEDEGRSFNETTTQPSIQWDLTFTGLTYDEWQIFETFARGVRLTQPFNFKDKFGTVWSNVRVDTYERSHTRNVSWSSNVHFILVKYP
jgi:Putative Ig domain